MDIARIDEMLLATLDDTRLTRGERQALAAAFAEMVDGDRDVDVVRGRAFALARSRHTSGDASLTWLEGIVTVLEGLRRRPVLEVAAEAWFSPGDACLDRLLRLIRGATARLDVCVYTVTDDRIAEALLDAHQRRLAIRVISDDVKAGDLGSDVDRLATAGIPVSVDRGPGHMHHKFLLADGRVLAVGSYNWTRSAATENHEDLVVTDHPELVAAFSAEFELLWRRFR